MDNKIWFRNLNPRSTRYGLETLILGKQDMGLETLLLGQQDMV